MARDSQDQGKTSMLKRALFLLMALAIASSACMHPPRDYPGKLGSRIQEWLYYRSGADIHLITNQHIASDRELPKEIAWVIPLPAVPREYREEKDSLFQWLFRSTEIMDKSLSRSGPSRSSGAGFILHAKAYVGKYVIQPLEVVDTVSGSQINNWLYANGFAKVPQEGLRYYLHAGHCFLAIKVRNLDGAEKTLKPLHIVYASERASIPLKFFANAGIFDAYVYYIRPKYSESGWKHLEASGFRFNGQADLTPAMREKWGIKGLPEGNVEIMRFLGNRLNDGGNRLSDWERDPQVELR